MHRETAKHGENTAGMQREYIGILREYRGNAARMHRDGENATDAANKTPDPQPNRSGRLSNLETLLLCGDVLEESSPLQVTSRGQLLLCELCAMARLTVNLVTAPATYGGGAAQSIVYYSVTDLCYLQKNAFYFK